MPSALSPPSHAVSSRLEMMKPEILNLDPDGDVVFTLMRYFDYDDISDLDAANGSPSPPKAPATDLKSLTKFNDEEDVCSHEQEVIIRVSSRHLILASSVFRAMLKRKFSESNALHMNGSVEVPLPEDDPDAFLILLNIIHGYFGRVPRTIDFQTFAQISILVDKYDMHEAGQLFSHFWFENLKPDIPKAYTDDIPAWICICWVFNKPEEFKHTTSLALRQGTVEIALGDLPIPSAIVDTINTRRLDALTKIITTLLMHHEDYLQSEHCSFECDALMLGSLTKRLTTLHLLPKCPDPPFNGLCFEAFAYRFKGGMYFPAAQRTSIYYYNHSKCAIPSIDPMLSRCEKQLEGLDLNDYK
ncbi:hypothetical protein AJ80_00558 [Polytolypa hystricis UAMH7299]|uniref:Uncharacterized protein n=1 Tax=Polytolypa hystricis (strain UAMH7299) TaxID=1447883 RepID=A0A2B7Z2Z0_POLH7|nr:hypothetical protein AJ80_00558 [Polytolypa hystricis UAMH7299]